MRARHYLWPASRSCSEMGLFAGKLPSACVTHLVCGFVGLFVGLGAFARSFSKLKPVAFQGPNKSKQILVFSDRSAKVQRVLMSSQWVLNATLEPFRKLLQLHFPHVRNPRRNTDVCSHCQHYSKRLVPAAQTLVAKIRTALVELCPGYCDALPANQLDELEQRSSTSKMLSVLRFAAQS